MKGSHLRNIGFDTLLLEKKDQFVLEETSKKEKRVILTSDKKFQNKEKLPCFHINPTWTADCKVFCFNSSSIVGSAQTFLDQNRRGQPSESMCQV